MKKQNIQGATVLSSMVSKARREKLQIDIDEEDIDRSHRLPTKDKPISSEEKIERNRLHDNRIINEN